MKSFSEVIVSLFFILICWQSNILWYVLATYVFSHVYFTAMKSDELIFWCNMCQGKIGLLATPWLLQHRGYRNSKYKVHIMNTSGVWSPILCITKINFTLIQLIMKNIKPPLRFSSDWVGALGWIHKSINVESAGS